MAELLKGIDVVNALKDKLIEKNNELITKGITPCLNIVRVGERPDDLSYERGALKRFSGLGLKTIVSVFPEYITQAEFEEGFKKINEDDSVHGILLFRPLPKTLDEEPIKRMIDPDKDIDCMCAESMAKVFMGDPSGYPPCTPAAVLELIKHYDIQLSGSKVALIGRSLVVGKPLAMLLVKENATVTICHTKTADLEGECQKADIVIAAAGAAKMISKGHIRQGAVVIDVGINVDEEGNLCGDVDFQAAEQMASRITPVPGGVGTVTTSVLAKHTLMAAEKAFTR